MLVEDTRLKRAHLPTRRRAALVYIFYTIAKRAHVGEANPSTGNPQGIDQAQLLNAWTPSPVAYRKMRTNLHKQQEH